MATAWEEGDLAAHLLAPVQQAGRCIMAHAGGRAAVERKADQSPVTAADREAESVLLEALARVAPGVPVIAEESVAEGRLPAAGTTFFLVDPLDGTREFIAGESDFTVNVALIRDSAPCFGIVYAPALSTVHMTLAPGRAARATLSPDTDAALDELALTPLATRRPPAEGLVATVSRSHLDPDTSSLLSRLPVAATVVAGSSLKFCALAAGEADVYPRLSRTMEWDTAAGDAVLRAAGGAVLTLDGAPLAYGKAGQGYANPGFVAWGWPESAHLLAEATGSRPPP